MLAIGEPTVVVVLGEPWRAAGLAVVAMSGLAIGKAFASVSEEAIKGAGRTRMINRFTVTELVLGFGLLALIIPFGLVGVGLAISGTAVLIGLQCIAGARTVVGVTLGQVARVTLPPVLAGLVAAGAVAALEHLVLHSETHPVPLSIALLLLDGLAYLVVYLGVLAVIAPSTVKDVVRAVRRRRAG